MRFGRMISSYENTDSILKCNTIHNTYTYIVRGIKSKDAVMLIWNDILQGIQK